MIISPRLVPEKPAQRHRDLPVLIPVRSGRDRARIAQYLTAHLDQLRKGVAGPFFFYRLVLSKRHAAIMSQSARNPVINIAHYSK
jgi:hypothetical protein